MKRVISIVALSLFVSLFQYIPAGNAVGNATQLVLTRLSTAGASGSPFTVQPEFEVRDASGNAVSGTAFVISVYFREGGAPAPGNVGTTTATTGLDGKATFPSSFGISGNINTPIKIFYRISSISLYASEEITLTAPGVAAKLMVTRLATGPATGSEFGTQPQVTVKDAWNNNVGGTRTITASPSSGTLAGTVTATTDAVTGIATFSTGFGISDGAGVKTITYSSPDLASATQKVTIGNPSVPAAPDVSNVQFLDGESVGLFSTAPANGGSAITGYEYQIVGLSTWAPVTNLSTSNGFMFFVINTSNILRQSGFTYFQLRATNAVGTGPSTTSTQSGLGRVGVGSIFPDPTPPSSTSGIESGQALTDRIAFSGTPISKAYQWRSCTTTSSGSCTDIAGATSSTYALTDSDIGKYIRNIVTPTYSIGTGVAVTSSSTTQVLASSGPDTTLPTVTSTNSTTNNGAYKVGDQISIRVNFSESVAVTGTPRLTLETGSTDRAVNYASGTGTNQLTFTYTVQAGDTTADLDYISTSALDLNGGTIKDAAGNNATLTLAAPGSSNSFGANKAIVIDTTAPTVTLAATSAISGSATITFTVTGNEPITCSTLSSTHGEDFNFTSTGISAITGIVQTSANVCTITATSTATNGGGAVTSTLTAASTFSITDTAGNAQVALTGSPQSTSVTIDTTAPTVTLAATAATSGLGTVTFTVTGNEPIACSTLSTTSGTDFTYTGISSLSGIAQTSPTVCTITAISTAISLGETATATILVASNFSIADITGNAQATLASSPQSTLVTVADTTAPVLTLTSASAITSTSTNINFTSNEVGTYFYLLYPAADGPPDAAALTTQGAAVAKGTNPATAAANIANAIGLSANTAFKAYVIVKDAANNASAVATIAFTTPAIVPGTPGAPTAVAGNGQATVTVSAPTTGGTPTSYTVSASPGGATCTVTGASGSCTVTGLTNGTAYTFTSIASNTGGPSASTSVPSNSATPFAPVPVCDASCEAAFAKIIADRIASDAAAKVVAEKVTVDKSVAVAAAKAAVDKAAAAVVAKATADAAAANAAAVAKAAADAQQAAIIAAENAAATLKSSTSTAAAKAAATASAIKAASIAANSVQAAAAAAKVAATAKNKAANANRQVEIALGALGSKTAAATSATQANAIAAAAKAAANAAAKVAIDAATASKVVSNNAKSEAANTAASIATEQKLASDTAVDAKIATDAVLKATEEKITAATEAQKSAEAVVKALDEKIALAEASVKATDLVERAAIDKKIAEINVKIAEAQRVAEVANLKAEASVVAQEKAQAVAVAATQTAETQAAKVVAVRTESLAKTAVATKAAADASLAARIAKAAVAAATKVPARAVISAKPGTTSGKNSAQATITGLKPGQKVKVTVNVRGK